MSKNCFRSFDKSLASIGANDDSIIVNCTHACFDGQIMLTLVDMLQNGKDEESPEIFESFNDTWKHLFPEAKKYIKPLGNYTRVIPKYMNEFEFDPFTRFHAINTDIRTLECYNKETNKLNGYFDSLLTSVLLSIFAYNGKISDVFFSTMADTRHFLKKQSLKYGNHAAAIPLKGNCNEKTTVKDFALSMRNDLKEQNRLPQVLAYVSGYSEPPPPQPKNYVPPPKPPGVLIEVSSFGKIPLRQPFVDFWASIRMKSDAVSDSISSVSYSVETENGCKVVNGLRYCPQTFADKDAKLFTNSIRYSLQNIHPDMTCGEAISRIVDFQNDYIRKYK